MGKIFRRRGLALLSGFLCLVAAAIVVTALVNDPHKPDKRPWSAWVQANFSKSVEGAKQFLPKAGWKYFGIFKGYKEKSYSVYEGLRTEYFEGENRLIYIERETPSYISMMNEDIDYIAFCVNIAKLMKKQQLTNDLVRSILFTSRARTLKRHYIYIPDYKWSFLRKITSSFVASARSGNIGNCLRTKPEKNVARAKFYTRNKTRIPPGV